MLVYDSHEYIKKLVSAGVSEEQAEIHAQEFRRVVTSELATKKDIFETKKEISASEGRLNVKMAETETRLVKWVFGAFFAFFFANSAMMFTLFKLFLDNPVAR